MTEISDMLTDLCPDGVEFRTLGDVGAFTRGSGLQKKDFAEAGVGCIHYGQIYTYYGTSTAVTKSFVSEELAARLKKASPGDLVVTTTSENVDDVCKAVAWLGADDVVIGGHSCVYKHELDPLYVAYLFQSAQFQAQKNKYVSGTKVKDIKPSDLAKARIPVPPAKIQSAVVDILVKMEQLEAELKAELEAELEARSRQFEHYRETLLCFDGRKELSWRPMGEVGEFIRGRRFTKADYVDGGIPAIHYGEIYTRYGTFASHARTEVRPALRSSLRFAEPGDVVIAAVGETVEDVGKAVAWLGETDVAIHDDCFAFKHQMNPKFVAYFFQTGRFHHQLSRHVARAKVKRISAHGLAQVQIPVLSLAEQEDVVEVLDAFDELVNDLSSCLPAEMSARRKQYEYYRDLLLTFPEMTS